MRLNELYDPRYAFDHYNTSISKSHISIVFPVNLIEHVTRFKPNNNFAMHIRLVNQNISLLINICTIPSCLYNLSIYPVHLTLYIVKYAHM